MGKVVEEKKKKKKGRPSLLDLQKRSIKQEQEQEQLQQQKQNSNSNPNPNLKSSTVSSTPVRRSTRRNPNPDPEEDENDTVAAAEDEEELSGRRREKKLKLVLRLPSQLNSASLNSASCGSDSNAEEENVPASHKKRKINAIGDGSGHVDSEKAEKPISGASNQQGTELDGGPATPLPDKKLLVFVLDRLQKKDSYGVFSEPVDPKELPDYHEVIEHPMDFGTVRKNLAGGAYASLEQFEKDVFLICSNAMQYNAPDTIYFKQARSIQELAKKNFENLRQDSDDNEPEPKRRGRPPTKNIKKPLGRPSLERPGSEFSSDATLATGGENTMWSNHDLRKGALISDKSGPADSFGRSLHGTRYSDGNTGWSADQKLERHDEFTGSILKGISLKHGKKPFVLDENRRNTYKQSSSIAVGREPSVLTTFDGEKKQLMPVGLNAEYGYARSLARFASNLGPVAWKIAAKKIEKSLPPGVKFGQGWVGENDVIPPKPLFVPSSTPLSSLPGDSIPCSMDSQEDKPSQKTGGIGLPERNALSARAALASHPGKSLLTSAAASPLINTANKASGPSSGSTEASIGLNAQPGFSILNSSAGAVRPRPPFQIHQGPTALHPGMNGFNGAYGFNIPTQMGKPMGAARPTGFNLQAPQMLDAISRTTPNFGHPGMGNNLTPEDPKFLEKSTTTNSSSPLLSHPGGEAAAAPRVGPHPQPSWPGLPPQQRQDSVPHDTGNSRGFGFVSYDSFEASDAAIEAMNGQYLCNRQITVSYAYKKDTKGERHGTPAERVLAASNPSAPKSRPHTLFASGPPTLPNVPQANGNMGAPMPPRPFANGVVPPVPIPAMRPPPPQSGAFPPMQLAGPPSWQGQPQQPGQMQPPMMPPPPLQQFRPPPPSMPPPPQQVMPALSRPPPPPALMGGPPPVWRPPPPPQQMAGRPPTMLQMSMPPPPPPPAAG